MEISFLSLVAAFGLGLWSGFALPFRAVWPLAGLAVIAGLVMGILSSVGLAWPRDDAMGLTVIPAVILFLIGQGIGAFKRREGGPF